MKDFRKENDERGASDAELVHAARRGDKRAFVEIVARHQAMVCGVALGILGDFAASEDAGQEAFLTAWRKVHELREPERLRAWLGQIARNAALGYLRRKRGHDALEEALALADESPSPDEATANEEEAALVRDSLAKLPEIYRLPLILFYREGHSVRAVAETLEITEDAVKQRLARGREMLRDRMAGMIETVLTRSGPTAVFTMAIAVAIGALAAPAVVAGTVFAAASVAAPSTAAVSSTPVLAVMSTSKTFLVTTALVAVVCIPVGYHFASDHSLPETNAVSRVEADAAKPADKPAFADSALFAEWRKLHDKHGTNAAAMPAIYKEIAEMKDAVRRRAFRAALMAEWVQVDPAGGFEFFRGRSGEGGQRSQFFEEWLAHDPATAVNALMAGQSGWEGMARDCLPEIARRVPSRVAEIVSRLPKSSNYWDTKVRDAFAILANGNLTSARKSAETLTGPNREQALAGVANAWAKSDIDGAIKWASGLPDGTDRNEIIRGAIMGRAAVDPASALDLVKLVPPGGREGFFADTTGARVLGEAAKANYDATVAWLAANPGRLGHEDMLGLAKAVTDRMNSDAVGFLTRHADDGSLNAVLPAIESAILNQASGQRGALWEWLKTQPESEATKSLKSSVLSSAAWQDPELALRLVKDVPHTPEGDTQVQNLARNLFNGGHMLHRFDKLMEQAPGRLREPLLDAAFSSLRADYMGDPQLWISRLTQLPETSRARGTESIARAWAEQSPEEAFGWVTSLPAGDARNGAVGAIASTWAKKDAHSAADWIASLPAGMDRDRSAGSLVLAVAQEFPREAWDWAMSIGDTLERSRAAAYAAQMMASRDLPTARQWVETGPFDPNLKAQLQLDLERRSQTQTQTPR